MTKRGARRSNSELELLREWTAWGARARRKYLRALLDLPTADREKDRGASFGSMHAIFVHILDDFLWWFEFVPQDRQTEYRALDPRVLRASELQRTSLRVDRITSRLLRSLTPGTLGRRCVIDGVGGDGQPYHAELSLADILWHMHEEQLQHLGELNALFWQMDVDPPPIAWWPG